LAIVGDDRTIDAELSFGYQLTAIFARTKALRLQHPIKGDFLHVGTVAEPQRPPLTDRLFPGFDTLIVISRAIVGTGCRARV
jgi:hypothetical protein